MEAAELGNALQVCYIGSVNVKNAPHYTTEPTIVTLALYMGTDNVVVN